MNFENGLVVGRAATAIYLILKKEVSESSEVLLPANICYAAVFPVIYSGCRPVFCDVDPLTGNVTKETLAVALGKTAGIKAAVLPHMYGEPISNFSSIVAFLRERGILVIEDCASAMGATLDTGEEAGELGDYSIYSTGYSKTLGVGYGGLLLSNCRDVSSFHAALDGLEFYGVEEGRRDALFSRLYRQIRNERRVGPFEAELFQGISKQYETTYVCRLDKHHADVVLRSLSDLPSVVRRRRENLGVMNEATSCLASLIRTYPYSSGSVPWRWCFTVPQEKRQELIDAALAVGIPISDWYPSVAGYFGDFSSYPGAEKMGDSILNLPLMLDVEELLFNAEKLKNVVKRVFGRDEA